MKRNKACSNCALILDLWLGKGKGKGRREVLRAPTGLPLQASPLELCPRLNSFIPGVQEPGDHGTKSAASALNNTQCHT